MATACSGRRRTNNANSSWNSESSSVSCATPSTSLPSLETLPFVETREGLRPATKDLTPFFEVIDERWAWLSGHYRHGVTLAPLAAREAVEFARSTLVIRFNGTSDEFLGETVEDCPGPPSERSGIAVAVDGDVVRRSHWSTTSIPDGATSKS